jgi:hypothetical protein
MAKTKKKTGETAKNYLLLTIKLVLILSIINSVYFEWWHLASMNIFLLFLTFIPQMLKKSQKITLPKEFEWTLLTFVIISLFIGRLSGWIIPLIFGVIMSLIGFMILLMLYSSGQIKKNYFLIILFAFSFAIVFGFGLEFLKYYLKIILGQPLTAEVYRFMMNNMTFIILGSVICSLIGYLYMIGKTKFISNIVEKFKRSNPKMFQKNHGAEEILEIIGKGESDKVEFKSTLRMNLHTNEPDKKIEHNVLKTMTSFLNSSGGIILVGISDNGEIMGIENDKFPNLDKFNLHFVNLIKQKIGKKNLSNIDFKTIEIDKRNIMKIECSESKKPVFLKEGKEEEFYIRVGPSTTEIKGSELVDYIKKNFDK